MLVLAMLVAIGCSGRRPEPGARTPEPAPEPPRIGIMTGSAAQDGEDFRAAQEVARRFPRRVMHITYPDNFPAESVTVAAQLTGLAGEAKLKAMVVGQAIPGSAAAAQAVRALRPDIRIAFVTPRDDPDSVAAACDLAIGPDEVERGRTIVAMAHDMGARSVVYYSFPRHLDEPLLAAQRDMMRSECARRGMRFAPVMIPDPVGADGPAREFVIRDVPRELQRWGPATAFYATSNEVQEQLVRALVEAQQGYLVEQALPGPSVGYPEALDVESEDGAEPDTLHAALRRWIGARSMGGHFGTWSASVQGVAMRAMGSLMLDALDRGVNPLDSATVYRYLEREARSTVHMRRVRPGTNQWLILLDHVTY